MINELYNILLSNLPVNQKAKEILKLHKFHTEQEIGKKLLEIFKTKKP